MCSKYPSFHLLAQIINTAGNIQVWIDVLVAAQERELQQYLAFEEDCLWGGNPDANHQSIFTGTQEFPPSLGIDLLADSVLTRKGQINHAHQM